MPKKPGIKIKELVDRTGVTKPTIYHYVREGLLPKPKKTARNMALYDPDCIQRILLIKGLQKHQRRSLAEVKAMLAGARGNEGIARLQRVLEAEANREKTSPLRPDRPTRPIDRAALIERTGFAPKDLEKLESVGLLTPTDGLYDPHDVDVVDALARLREAGFDQEHGFKAGHVAIYLETMRTLIQHEVSLFLEKVHGAEDPSDMLTRAERGLEHVTPLILAIRRKLLRQLLDAASESGENTDA